MVCFQTSWGSFFASGQSSVVSEMKHRLVHLDFLRGLAALMVCTSHLRAFLLVNYAQVEDPGFGIRALYFSTGLGHQAVMIFFVLSGFFVGGSVLNAYKAGKWSWFQYANRRLSRLWVVLLPTLLLTLLWDGVGSHLAREGYDGGLIQFYGSGPSPQSPIDLQPTAFFGNLLFLQTIQVPVFGTNGPLWSLANEFWYYLLFPLIAGVFWRGSMRRSHRLACGGIVSLIFHWLPPAILWSGLLWLFGVIAFVVTQTRLGRRVCGHTAWIVAAGVFAAGSLAASKTSSVLGNGMTLGAAFAMLAAGLAIRNSAPRGYAVLAEGMAETSYTLYLTHFSFLAFLFFTVFKGRQFQPDLHGLTLFAGILIVVLAYAGIGWWCFERNTEWLRKFFVNKFASTNRQR